MTGQNYTKTAFGTPGIRREDIERVKAVVGRRNQKQRGSIVVDKRRKMRKAAGYLDTYWTMTFKKGHHLDRYILLQAADMTSRRWNMHLATGGGSQFLWRTLSSRSPSLAKLSNLSEVPLSVWSLLITVFRPSLRAISHSFNDFVYGRVRTSTFTTLIALFLRCHQPTHPADPREIIEYSRICLVS